MGHFYRKITVSNRRLGLVGVFALTLALLLSVFDLSEASAKSKSDSVQKSNDKHTAAELIIRMKPGFPLTPQFVSAFDKSAVILDQIPDLQIYRIGYDPKKVEADEIATIQSLPTVQYVDLNYIDQTPTGNPYFANGGTLDTTPYTQQYAGSVVQATSAQQISTGAGVTVAVLDTGVDLTHPAFASHLVLGYDFVNNDATPSDLGGGIASGHGTAVAGLALLVAPQAQIMPVRVLDTTGQGTLWNVLKGIKYASDHSAKVINMSLGTSANTNSLTDLVTYAEQQGIVVAASAGNDNSNTPQYPCAITGVLCVAATDKTNLKASFSDYGAFVTISAPGVSLYSPYWDGTYASWSGTSMSSPLVAGGAALVASKYPGSTVNQITSRLLTGSNNALLYLLNPLFSGQLGTGLLNLYQALQ